MAKITRIYKQHLPALKLVGRRYTEQDKINNTFSAKWQEWFEGNLFAPLQLPDTDEPFEDCDAYIGLSRCQPGQPYEYWIGVFLPVDAQVPQGYQSLELPEGDIAVCWVYGKEPDVYFYCCLSELNQNGYKWSKDENGVSWCFERYVCPRFTKPDKDGNLILDMCFYI